MIPPFNASGVLPPYIGANSINPTLVSPFRATILEFTTHFASSSDRRAILKGLIGYRAALTALGIADGYQWLNGSFCSDIEKLEKRSLRDVDVVTFARRPLSCSEDQAFKIFSIQNLAIFSQALVKSTYKVDAYYTDMNIQPHLLVERASYWHGVFGHQRVTSLWKGMVRIELSCNDQAAHDHLDYLDTQDSLSGGTAADDSPDRKGVE